MTNFAVKCYVNECKNDVRRRMSYQWPDERKKALADKVVLNDEHTPLIPQMEALMAELGGIG